MTSAKWFRSHSPEVTSRANPTLVVVESVEDDESEERDKGDSPNLDIGFRRILPPWWSQL